MTAARRERAIRSLDAEAAALNEFKREGAFLFLAELESAKLVTQCAGITDPCISISASDLSRIARQFARAVAIAKEYHLGAAETI